MATGLCLQGVAFKYSGHDPVFHGFDLVIRPGRTVLLGPNGAGKSTLARILSGVAVPSAGTIGMPGCVDVSARELHRCIGYMPQEVRPVPGLRVAEQVAYAAWLAGVPRRASMGRALDALKRVDLLAKAESHAGRLSGGQLRRVGLAQVLAADPQFLILDEPTAGLDPAQRVGFRRVLESLELPLGVLVVTHQVDDLADTYDDVIVLDQGSIVFQGSPREFLHLSDQGADAAYLHLVGGEE